MVQGQRMEERLGCWLKAISWRNPDSSWKLHNRIYWLLLSTLQILGKISKKKSAASDFFLQDDDALKKITIDWEGKKGSLAAE